MPKLVITVDFDDPSDFDFARHQIVAAVEAELDPDDDESLGARLDGTTEVSWDVED